MWRRKQSGFSLIEGLIVISIVFIMAAMAAPQFRETLIRYQLEAKARNVAGLVQTVRREAARQNRRITLKAAPLPSGDWAVYVDANRNNQLDRAERRVLFTKESVVIPAVFLPIDLTPANNPDYGPIPISLAAVISWGYTFAPDGTLLDNPFNMGRWRLETQIRSIVILQATIPDQRLYAVTITPAGNTRLWSMKRSLSGGSFATTQDWEPL